MAIMKIEEIRELSDEELDQKLEDLKEEYMKMKTQIAQGTPPDKPGRVKEVKKTIARILTIKKERGVL